MSDDDMSGSLRSWQRHPIVVAFDGKQVCSNPVIADGFEYLTATEARKIEGRPPGFGAAGGVEKVRRKQERPLRTRRPSVSEGVASPMPSSWNQIASWLKQIDAVRQAA